MSRSHRLWLERLTERDSLRSTNNHDQRCRLGSTRIIGSVEWGSNILDDVLMVVTRETHAADNDTVDTVRRMCLNAANEAAQLLRNLSAPQARVNGPTVI